MQRRRLGHCSPQRLGHLETGGDHVRWRTTRETSERLERKLLQLDRILSRQRHNRATIVAVRCLFGGGGAVERHRSRLRIGIGGAGRHDAKRTLLKQLALLLAQRKQLEHEIGRERLQLRVGGGREHVMRKRLAGAPQSQRYALGPHSGTNEIGRERKAIRG
jgi:hypothetical protein